MSRLDPRALVGPFSYLGGTIAELKLIQRLGEHISSPRMPLNMRALFLFHVNSLEAVATELSMVTFLSVLRMERSQLEVTLANESAYVSKELGYLASVGDKLLSVFISEIETRWLIALPTQHANYFEAKKSNFGSEVDQSFPNSSIEISEAGKCRAVGLWTAAVMHLMRAVEEPLTMLAAELGVKPEQNWNVTLDQIEKALREIKKSIHGDEEEQWASEASAHMRAIKNAWRNHAQHGKVHYAESEMITVWHNVMSLLQTLAKKIPKK